METEKEYFRKRFDEVVKRYNFKVKPMEWPNSERTPWSPEYIEPIKSKMRTKVIHSETDCSWKVVNKQLGEEYEIAVVPYVESTHPFTKQESYNHAIFISNCFNSK